MPERDKTRQTPFAWAVSPRCDLPAPRKLVAQALLRTALASQAFKQSLLYSADFEHTTSLEELIHAQTSTRRRVPLVTKTLNALTKLLQPERQKSEKTGPQKSATGALLISTIEPRARFETVQNQARERKKPLSGLVMPCVSVLFNSRGAQCFSSRTDAKSIWLNHKRRRTHTMRCRPTIILCLKREFQISSQPEREKGRNQERERKK